MYGVTRLQTELSMNKRTFESILETRIPTDFNTKL